ncbi:putative sugar phosphate/phosphate translocator [Glarea lozoyensis 74030]|uniref:Putative sugar phosphate/phosphate translocator n=1 Tax=Glarea lozoyensis (strain ATCC 74030 / MF5533) TaxID=1104152 RepID=H0ETV9_GLAL7|nr:putative sugar phosphate/phosphate translocator [Glarea lozoyensis 74030]
MTGRVYLRAIVPIGVFFSLSLICGNLTYLYLSVSFIQMLKATTPVAVLVAGWCLGLEKPDLKKLGNVSFIVIGVVLASFGEIDFVLIGFLYQMGGIAFEAIGKTSGLVLTLCGVLKDILLVIASILIWGTKISGLQVFGYGIALAGMVYYKLGQKELKPFIQEGSRKWAEFGATRPVLRKLIVIGAVFSLVVLLLAGVGPQTNIDTKKLIDAAKSYGTTGTVGANL